MRAYPCAQVALIAALLALLAGPIAYVETSPAVAGATV